MTDGGKAGGDLPRTVKIDLDTPLERLWSGLAFLSLIACLVILCVGILGTDESPPDPAFLRFLPWAIGAGVIFLFLRSFTNNYYLADMKRQALYYHFAFAGFRSVREYLRFSDVDSVIVNGFHVTTEDSEYYEYQLQLIDRGGRIHEFSDRLKGPELDKLNDRAETISELIGCRLVPGKAEHTHTITGQGAAIRISTVHDPLSSTGAICKTFFRIDRPEILVILALGIFTAILVFLL